MSDLNALSQGQAPSFGSVDELLESIDPDETKKLLKGLLENINSGLLQMQQGGGGGQPGFGNFSGLQEILASGRPQANLGFQQQGQQNQFKNFIDAPALNSALQGDRVGQAGPFVQVVPNLQQDSGATNLVSGVSLLSNLANTRLGSDGDTLGQDLAKRIRDFIASRREGGT